MKARARAGANSSAFFFIFRLCVGFSCVLQINICVFECFHSEGKKRKTEKYFLSDFSSFLCFRSYVKNCLRFASSFSTVRKKATAFRRFPSFGICAVFSKKSHSRSSRTKNSATGGAMQASRGFSRGARFRSEPTAGRERQNTIPPRTHGRVRTPKHTSVPNPRRNAKANTRLDSKNETHADAKARRNVRASAARRCGRRRRRGKAGRPSRVRKSLAERFSHSARLILRWRRRTQSPMRFSIS